MSAIIGQIPIKLKKCFGNIFSEKKFIFVTAPECFCYGFSTHTRENSLKMNKINLYDLLACCRCCFKKFHDQSVKIFIKFQQQMAFHQLTDVELKMDSIYSKFICSDCDKDLKKFTEFRASVAEKQKQLYECQPNLILKVEPASEYEHDDSQYNSSICIPEIPIKTELRECFVKIQPLNNVSTQNSYSSSLIEYDNPLKIEVNPDDTQMTSEEESTKNENNRQFLRKPARKGKKIDKNVSWSVEQNQIYFFVIVNF